MFKIGIGYDVHAFINDRKLVLGGIVIPYERGLAGHSDADVLIHAICDALLGAIGSGDIGQHFPDTDPAFKDIDSAILLKSVVDFVAKEGYIIGNIDTVLIMQEPRIGPLKKRIKQRLASIMGLEENILNIKATTTEKLGFEGRGEGIAAQAVVLIHKR